MIEIKTHQVEECFLIIFRNLVCLLTCRAHQVLISSTGLTSCSAGGMERTMLHASEETLRLSSSRKSRPTRETLVVILYWQLYWWCQNDKIRIVCDPECWRQNKNCCLLLDWSTAFYVERHKEQNAQWRTSNSMHTSTQERSFDSFCCPNLPYCGVVETE